MIKYYENNDISTKIEWKFVGHGSDAQAVYCKFVTVFSIADGVILDRKYVAPKIFYR